MRRSYTLLRGRPPTQFPRMSWRRGMRVQPRGQSSLYWQTPPLFLGFPTPFLSIYHALDVWQQTKHFANRFHLLENKPNSKKHSLFVLWIVKNVRQLFGFLLARKTNWKAPTQKWGDQLAPGDGTRNDLNPETWGSIFANYQRRPNQTKPDRWPSCGERPPKVSHKFINLSRFFHTNQHSP